MNKTKLEVIRINEDVVATSGVCKAHPDKEHYYAYDYSGYMVLLDYYKIGETTPNSTTSNIYSNFRPTILGANQAVGKWYYNKDGYNYYECDGNHDNYNPNTH